MSDATDRGAVFVLPTSVAGQLGPVAAWTSTAGWAAAARRVLGAAWIVTPSGEIEPDAARRRGSGPQLRSTDARGWRRDLQLGGHVDIDIDLPVGR